MPRHQAIGFLPWMVCAAASAGVIGLFLFGLRGEPVDLGKYVGAEPRPVSLQRVVLDDPRLTVSEGRGHMSVMAEPPAEPAPPEQVDAQPKDPQPTEAVASPAEPEPEAEPVTAPESALALLSPEPPRDVRPAPKAVPPRARSIRKPVRAHAASSVQRRTRAVMRRMRGPPMRTITIYHGPYFEVIRVPR